MQVKRIVDMGSYVSLLEYDNHEGMLLNSELSKRRIRSLAKLVKVGKTEICMVLRVDQEKGYVDLSKRRVEPEDATAKEESFAKAKAVHGIMRRTKGLEGPPKWLPEVVVRVGRKLEIWVFGESLPTSRFCEARGSDTPDPGQRVVLQGLLAPLQEVQQRF